MSGDGSFQQEQKRQFSEDAASPDPSGSDNKKRRTITGASAISRGVANLTPDQLAKKRANDREAQRAIRERTKNQIENLERRIKELTSQQPYQELQHVLRQKEQVEAENADIKRRLATVLSLIEPILGQHAPGYAALPTSLPPSYASIPNRPTSSSNLNVSTPNTVASPASASTPGAPNSWQAPSAPMGHEPRPYVPIQSAQTQQLAQQRHDMTHNLDLGPEKLGLEFLLDGSQRITKSGKNGSHETASSFQRLPGDSEKESSIHRRRSNSNTSHNSTLPTDLTGHSAPIRNGPPTCPLDSLLLDFLHERQQQAADGVSTPKLVGPAYPSVSSLLNPSLSIHSHPLSKVFTDILATFPDLSTLPEKLAVLYTMFLLMRWQISPSPATYDHLPSWMCPRADQLFTPHPAWIDHLPWPKMRDRLVRDYNPRDYLFDHWFIPFTTTLSVNWPYEDTDCLLQGQEGEEVVINPVFERHLRRLENWTLGPGFAKAFPGLEGTYALKEGERR